MFKGRTGIARLFLLLLGLALGTGSGLQAAPAPAAGPNDANYWMLEATNHLGQWIWDTNTFDKQTCHFWRAIEIPAGVTVVRARARITADNGYSLFLDGREIGRGSDWKTLTEYDLKQVLPPGRHILGVEGFNDRLKAGIIFGLQIQLSDDRTIEVFSDGTWFVVPLTQRDWAGLQFPEPEWGRTVVVGKIGQDPWQPWPYGVVVAEPVLPEVVHFWQTTWFQLLLILTSSLAVFFSVWLLAQLAGQGKAQQFLQRERARIARDIHDDLGGQLTQIVLMGEVAQREQVDNAPAREQFRQICEQAREVSRAMDEVVWAVNSRRDTLREFVTYVCKYAQSFLSATAIRCRLDVEADLPELEFDLPTRRNLFLAVKEALSNAAKHSQADELFVRIYCQDQQLVVALEDNGQGFDPAQADAQRNGLTNMAQRMAEIGGTHRLVSAPGTGCLAMFTVPFKKMKQRFWFGRWRQRAEISGANSTGSS